MPLRTSRLFNTLCSEKVKAAIGNYLFIRGIVLIINCFGPSAQQRCALGPKFIYYRKKGRIDFIPLLSKNSNLLK